MRITHVLKATGLSGAEAHLLALSTALRAEGVDSRLAVLVDRQRPPEVLLAAAQAQGVAVSQLDLASHFDLRVVPQLASLFKSTGTQVVHTHMIHGDLYGALAARMTKLTLVQTRHNDDKFRRWLPMQLLSRLLADQAKTVIAISESLAAFVRDVEGVPGPKIVSIPYGLDPAAVTAGASPGALRAELGLGPEIPLIAAVGRLTEQKGFRYLLEALAHVWAEVPQAHLVIAGEGPLRAELAAQAAGLGDAVHFLGWRTDAPTIMADCNVLAVPSLWEGFGLVTLEAMALSKPVVASRVSALPEIVLDGPQGTGLLVPPADPAALAAALITLLTDPAQARARGARGHARLEKEFTVRRMARKHVTVYTEAASRVPEFRA